MSQEPIAYSKTVQIVDFDGRSIRKGSVLRHITDPDVGVVDRIILPGENPRTYFPVAVGDICIRYAPGSHRVTNQYKNWRHVPHDEQTFEQRYLSWLLTEERAGQYLPTEGDLMTEEQARCVAGIMALLPAEAVDSSYGPFPDTLEHALEILARYLTKLSGQEEA